MSSKEDLDMSKSNAQGQSEQYTSFESKYNRQNASPKWIFVDVLCFLAVSVSISLFHNVGDPYSRGFYCDDESIKKPFKASTVSSTVAAIVGLSLPGISFIIVELLHHYDKVQRLGLSKTPGRVMYIGPIKLNYLALRIIKIISIFMYGAALNVVITDMGKYTLGRLRPHFLDVCKPDIDWSNCTGVFITSDVCTGTTGLIREARLSFPSGHSSFSAFTMVFLALYYQARVSIPSSVFLKSLLLFFPILLALLCGLSRISDYKHHWSDVLAGFVLGSVLAYLFVWQSLDWFKENTEEKKQAHKNIV